MANNPRLDRLMAANGTLLSVAIDHGVFGELQIMRGAESLAPVVDRVLEARPDAIQLSLGAAERLMPRLRLGATRLVARVDITNVYLRQVAAPLFSDLVQGFVERALRLDVAAVVVNLIERPGDGLLLRDCIANITRAKAACAPYGLPLIVEPLVLLPSGGDSYGVDGRVERILPLVRQAVELGADLVKADPTDDLGEYPAVISAAAGVPVLVRGGGKVEDQVLLERTKAVLLAGACGVVYGRNIFQHQNPADIVRQLQALLAAAPSHDLDR
jgi:class I fructose-bisphosphate aldolase